MEIRYCPDCGNRLKYDFESGIFVCSNECDFNNLSDSDYATYNYYMYKKREGIIYDT